MKDNSKTFCILPFIHMQVKPTGQMKPCCRFEFHNTEYLTPDKSYYFDAHNVSSDVSMTESLNSEVWEDIRQTLLKNEPVAGCNKCYKEESISGFSMRTNENRIRNNDVHDAPSYDVSKPVIKYLEMTFGNYCNLKCRTCNADLSSTWWEDENTLVDSGKYPDRFYYIRTRTSKTISIPFNWRPEDFVHVEEIKFTGGEPMIHPDFLRLMDMLIDLDVAKNIKLDVFTNCSWIPGEKYLSKLSKFRKVLLSLSVDGVGEVNDYIRHPSKWETVDQAVTTWLKLEDDNRSNVHVAWNPTINIYNILQIKTMIDWWFKKNDEINPDWLSLIAAGNNRNQSVVPAGKFKFNVLQDPEYISMNLLKQLDPSLRNKVIEDMTTAIGELNWRNKRMHRVLLSKLIDDLYELPIGKEVMDSVKDELKQVIKNHNYSTDHWLISDMKVKFTKIIKNIESGNSTTEDLEKFITYTNDLDKLRQEDFASTFPELSSAIKNDNQ
jgi:sulfatase maturation enzyme AslB (radical SAM superfamily)